MFIAALENYGTTLILIHQLKRIFFYTLPVNREYDFVPENIPIVDRITGWICQEGPGLGGVKGWGR